MAQIRFGYDTMTRSRHNNAHSVGFIEQGLRLVVSGTTTLLGHAGRRMPVNIRHAHKFYP